METGGKAHTIVAWVLQALMAAAFIMAGGSKLLGDPQSVALFDAIGWGQWFRYLTGALEVGSGLALLVPGLAGLGAALLVATMVGALLTHAFIGGTAIPATVLLLICAAIVWLRRDQLAALRARFA
jgi:putative oxidoreductase